MANEYEPMEVDLSQNSTHAMDISYTDSDRMMSELIYQNHAANEGKIKNEPDTDTSNINERLIASPTPTVIKRFSLKIPRQNKTVLSNNMITVAVITLSLISLLIYQIAVFKCSKEFNLDMLEKSLSHNLFGQSHAIEDIIASLKETASSKILMFYGGTGVGKTYTISLILENYFHYANIYHYTMPSFVETHSTDLMIGLTICPSSLIVLDNLNRADMHISDHIKKLIEKSEYLQKNITIIMVFNCDTINDQYIKKCDNSFLLELEQTFIEINAFKRVIQFHTLHEKHLKKCIEKELGSRKLREGMYKNIIKNLNVSIDGCKGVYKKIKMLNII